MCGIFGALTAKSIDKSLIRTLANQAMQRGIDSSGLYFIKNDIHYIKKSSYRLDKLLNKTNLSGCSFVAGHSRLITNGSYDNQPIRRDCISVLHNGIIVNHNLIWDKISDFPRFEIDSEIIVSLFSHFLKKDMLLGDIPNKIFEICEGVVSCAVLLEKQGKLVLLSNNGSLFFGRIEKDFFFASEKYSLELINCKKIKQLKNDYFIVDIPINKSELKEINLNFRKKDYVPSLNLISNESSLLK